MPRISIVLAALALLAPATAARAASAGARDGAFARGGTLTVRAPGADAVGGAVRVISGGRVLVGGAVDGKLAVLRLRRTGTLDHGFGSGGRVVAELPGTSIDGVRALATFRDGRIVAAATLRSADGDTRFALVRLLPNGEIDPSFGAGLGYVITGPAHATLGAMTMDRAGNILVAGSRPNANDDGEIPLVVRLAPDGTLDTTFGSEGVVDGVALGLTGRATGVLARPDGSVVFCVGAGADRVGPAIVTTVRLLPSGALDPAFAGSGIVSLSISAHSGPGAGATAIHAGPSNSVLVAGTDYTARGTARAVVVQLRTDGSLDWRFAIAYVTRPGRDLRVTAMTRDAAGRVVLAGATDAPASFVARLDADGSRDEAFGTGGITYPRLGRPPGGTPVYTTIDGIDAAAGRIFTVGSAAGPGPLDRGITGTRYGGRFALTVSRLR